MRERSFNMRMTDEEWARLDALVAHYESSASAVVRFLVRREHEALGLAPGKTKSAKTTKKGRK